MNMDESIVVSTIINKPPPSWKDLKHNLKHQKYELSLVQLSSNIRIEESLCAKESDKSDKPKGKLEFGQPSVHMVEKKQGIRTKMDMANTSRNMSQSTPTKREKIWFVGGVIKLGIASVIAM